MDNVSPDDLFTGTLKITIWENGENLGEHTFVAELETRIRLMCSCAYSALKRGRVSDEAIRTIIKPETWQIQKFSPEESILVVEKVA